MDVDQVVSLPSELSFMLDGRVVQCELHDEGTVLTSVSLISLGFISEHSVGAKTWLDFHSQSVFDLLLTSLVWHQFHPVVREGL